MHVDLLSTTKGSPKIIHGTENGKKTACGINLTRPENIGMFTNAGQMNDVIQLTCEKCKTVIAKKLIRESNKEMAAQLKEEQRQLKRERAASKHHHDVPVPPPVSSGSSGNTGSSGSGYIPPSMRKAMQTPQKPIEAPPPAPPAPAPVSVPQPVRTQTEVPSVPTSLPGMIPPAKAPVANSAEDVLAQFAIPTVPSSLPQTPPPAPVVPNIPAPAADDVLAQFAIPTVPSSLPQTPPPAPVGPEIPAPAPIADSAEDVLAQFAIPTVPSSLPQTPPPAPVVPESPAPVPVEDSVDDVLAQFTVPSVPSYAPKAPELSMPEPAAAPSASAHVSGSSVNQDDILAQFALKQPGSHPYPADDEIPDDYPSAAPEISADPLADLLLMPKGQSSTADIDSLPDLTNVPSSIPEIPVVPASLPQASVPSLDIPQAPPAPPVPQMPVPPVPQEFTAPVLPQSGYPVPPVQGFGQVPQQNPYPTPQFNPFAVPTAPKQTQPDTPTPLFVGYSADGRQLFQKYDTLGNPIPINEPVYSAPPEQKDHNIAAQVAAMAANSALRGNAPVMDLDEIMATMGIQDPSKAKKEEGKAINYTEYKIPEKKKKKPASSRPAASMPNAVPDGPVSAAEAKRRKKVDKINKEFEKQLRSRGIDPKTGGIILDSKK